MSNTLTAVLLSGPPPPGRVVNQLTAWTAAVTLLRNGGSMVVTTSPTGTVSLLFSDIDGSTVLLGRLGPAYADALTGHRQVLHRAWSAHGGTEMGTGRRQLLRGTSNRAGRGGAATCPVPDPPQVERRFIHVSRIVLALKGAVDPQ